jgi:FkbM family methyltransferase
MDYKIKNNMIVKLTAYNGKTANLVIRDENEHIQRCWKGLKFYESHKGGILSYMMNNLDKYSNKKCLDIGACIGNHTIYFSKILGCEVTSFEPSQESYDHLLENCKLNDISPILHNIALGEEKKTAGLRNNSKKHFNIGMNQVVEGEGIQVEKLDSMVEGQFDFIKIDVEHYNIPLLKGAKETLTSQVKCDVFIECETDSILKETDNIMKSYGYVRNLKIKLNHTPTYLWTKNN